MMKSRIGIGIVVMMTMIIFQDVGRAEGVADAPGKVKDIIERLVLGEDRDVYKPIRKGRVKLDPLACGAELPTWKVFDGRRFQWHLQTYARNYQRHGHRSVIWNDKVEAMLRDYAVFRREQTDAAFMGKLLKQVNQILELGCKDGRVISIKGIVLYSYQSAVDAAPFLKQGLALLEQSSYPKRYAYFAASHLRWVYRDSRGVQNPFKTYQRKAMQYLGEAAGDNDYRDGNQRYYIQEFIKAFDCESCTLPEDAAVCMDAMAATPSVDPWIALVARGIYHIGTGWQYRGDKYSSAVPKENMKKFTTEMALARQCLVQAHELHPEFPEAAAKMIHVAMTEVAREDMWRWFHRTIEAQFDYVPAYDDLLFALRPRWRGSHDAMLKFGIECLNTQRYDTRVPSKFLVSLFQIGSELDNWRTPYQWPGIYDLIQQYFDGIITEPVNKAYEDENKSFYAVVAWAAGQYKDAHRIMQELGPRFDHKAYGYLEVTREEVVNDIQSRVK